VDSKAEYWALSSTRSQKKKLKQPTQCPFNTVQAKIREVSPDLTIPYRLGKNVRKPQEGFFDAHCRYYIAIYSASILGLEICNNRVHLAIV